MTLRTTCFYPKLGWRRWSYGRFWLLEACKLFYLGCKDTVKWRCCCYLPSTAPKIEKVIGQVCQSSNWWCSKTNESFVECFLFIPKVEIATAKNSGKISNLYFGRISRRSRSLAGQLPPWPMLLSPKKFVNKVELWWLIRLSIGIEDVQDLIEDLDQAIA